MNNATTKSSSELAHMAGPALFVGGANDGNRMAVPDLPIIRLPLPLDQQTSRLQFKTENYRKERIVIQDRIFEFYMSESISLESAIVRLLAHYNP